MSLPEDLKIAVIGLGCVGLALAVALSRHFAAVGFDIDRAHLYLDLGSKG